MRSVALKRLAKLMPGQSPSSEEVSEFDGEGLPFLQGNAEFGALYPTPSHRCDTASRRCDTGDILVSVRAPVGALNIADRPYGIGRGLCALRAIDADPRFLWWLLHARIEGLHAVATGSTYEAVTGEDLGALRVVPPSTAGQRAIAGYLDSETSRIDALIGKKRRMIERVGERREAVVEETIRALVETHDAKPLKYVVRRVEVGIVVTPAAWYASEGVLALRSLNVRAGAISLNDTVRLSPEGHRLNRKSELHAGDVVVVRTGQTGAAAVVPSALDGCNCIDLVIVRPSTMLLPKFLEFVLNSDWTQKHIEEHEVGTIQSHFNVGALRQIPIPVPPVEVQHKAVEHLAIEVGKVDRIVRTLSDQVSLLLEHRQALITAAVTGELDIPVVAA